MSDIKLTKRQTEAWTYLTDDHTTQIVFGGAAGGAKSTLGCIWITYLCLNYPGVRCLIGRTSLTALKQTTLNTLFDVFGWMGFKADNHYHYNAQSNVISFNNGSEILLKDLIDRPSDLNKDSLGSLELTAIFVDEFTQISHTTYSVLKSRIRYKLTEYNLIPKMLLTCNPSHNWVKSEFYKPWKEGRLAENIAFIPSLPLDNPHLPSSYIELLQTLPEVQRERLLMGNWDYLDDPTALFTFDMISSSIYRSSFNQSDKKYLSVDVARFGDDKTVIVVWIGMSIIEIKIIEKASTTEVAEEIKLLMKTHGIHPNNIVVDSDGVGGGVADQIKGCVNFVNNSAAQDNENFINLKSQCYTRLSEEFKTGNISLNINDPVLIDNLTQELLSVKLKNLDKDNKIGVLSKDEQKRILGHSPDISDAIMMRMYWVSNKKSTGKYNIKFL